MCFVVTNQNGFVQAQITEQAQIDVHIPILVHFDLLDDPLELGIGHLMHIGNVLDLLESLLQDAFQLLALCQVVGHHFQLVFQPFDLFPHPTDPVIQLLTADQIISIHIHVFLAGLLQLGKLGVQFLFIVQVFILCLIDPLEFPHHIADDVFLCF